MLAADSTLEYITAISTALAAVGTLAAVVVALYLNIWRERRRQPALAIDTYEETWFGVGWNPGERRDDDVWGVPVLVRNGAGRKTARGTEVLVTVSRFEDNEWVDYIIDQPLIWKTARVPDGLGLAVIDVPAGATRKLWLAFIGEPNVLYRTLSPGVPVPGLFADDEGQEIEYDAGSNPLPVSPPIAGVLATYPFSQDDPFWLWRDDEVRMRLTVTSHDSDAVTYETRVTFEFKRRAQDPAHEGGTDFITPVWSEFKRVKL